MKTKTTRAKAPIVAPQVKPAPVVVPLTEKPDIFADRLAKLTPEERSHLRLMLSDPLFLRLLRMVAVFKPSANCSGCGSSTRDEFSDARANARLGEIRGWELYETAIFLALNEAPQVKHAVIESFQSVESGFSRPSASTEPAKS